MSIEGSVRSVRSSLQNDLRAVLERIHAGEDVLKSDIEALEKKIPSDMRYLGTAGFAVLAFSLFVGFSVFSWGFFLGLFLSGLSYKLYANPRWNSAFTNRMARLCLTAFVTGGICWLVVGFFEMSYLPVREGVGAASLYAFLVWLFYEVKALFGGLRGK